MFLRIKWMLEFMINSSTHRSPFKHPLEKQLTLNTPTMGNTFRYVIESSEPRGSMAFVQRSQSGSAGVA